VPYAAKPREDNSGQCPNSLSDRTVRLTNMWPRNFFNSGACVKDGRRMAETA
jgi:hypothetical protein